MNALMTQASIIHDERSREASAMAAGQQGGDGFFTSIFLFVCVLCSPLHSQLKQNYQH
jgi:hypothetical protein